MKKNIMIFAFIALFIPSVSFAFFDPSSLLNLAISASMVDSENEPSPAFVSLTMVYNELFNEKKLTSGMAKDLWKALKEPELTYVGYMIDTLSEICEARNVTEAEELGIYIVKNTKKGSSFNIKMCSPEEFRDEIAQGKIAYVHITKDLVSQTGEEEFMNTMSHFLGIRQYWLAAASNAPNQTDVAFVVTGIKDGKALVFNGKEETEADFEDIVNSSDYIVAFSSPKLQVRIEQEQNKSETEDYLEKIRQEVKQ